MHKLNIIIPALGGKEWTGGLTYQENLIGALKTRNDICIYVINDIKGSRTSPQGKSLNKRILNGIKQLFLSAEYVLSQKILGYNRRLSLNLKPFANARTNVIFTHNHSFLNIQNGFIKVYWIPDFQHVHLPHLFTEEQINDRNSKFLEGCKLADIVILSSYNAQQDLVKFAPEHVHKSAVSNFVAGVEESIWDKDPSYLLEKYFIPSKFFFLPNQFWKHKNHIVVFKALHYLKQKGIHPTVMCTGNPSEFRNPGYYNELTEKIKDWEIGDQIRVLGLVPHDDVLMLLRQSIAVINPSLFEGWSTTVEESKSIGKHIILSDIPVHREQSPQSVEFFPPHDHIKLAELLQYNWEKLQPGPNIELEKNARQNLPGRKAEYADNFLNIIKSFQQRKNELPEAEFEKPVLFLIFNRPDQTKAVFEQIRKIRPARLFIAADGPRSHVPEDRIKCREAREIINQIDWKCDLKLLFREKNLSLKEGVSSAINWFFANVEEGIILEDDCLADESFFNYCSELLDHYRDNEQIMHINGTNFLLGNEFDFDGSYYFSKICHPWGWATWKRAWLKYDIEMKGLDSFLDQNKLSEYTTNQNAIKFYGDSFTKTAAGKVNTWDYQWFFSVWKNDGIVISPAINLVTNIGFGKDATHTNYKYTRLSKMKRNRMYSMKHPRNIRINKQADEFTFEVNVREGTGNLLERLIAKSKLTLGLKS
jgi:glycosyltransferase involved in cell wall biosynthesis